MEYTLEQLKDLTRELEIHGAAQEQLSSLRQSKSYLKNVEDSFYFWKMDGRIRAMQKAKLLAKRKRQDRAVKEERYKYLLWMNGVIG